jgi:hypothetical protein
MLMYIPDTEPERSTDDTGTDVANAADAVVAEYHVGRCADNANIDVPNDDVTERHDDADADADTADMADVPDTIVNARLISALFAEAYQIDSFSDRIIGLLQDGTRHCKEISLADYQENDSRLVYRNCVYVPDHLPLRLRLLQDP